MARSRAAKVGGAPVAVVSRRTGDCGTGRATAIGEKHRATWPAGDWTATARVTRSGDWTTTARVTAAGDWQRRAAFGDSGRLREAGEWHRPDST